jgi:hypothetical protein
MAIYEIVSDAIRKFDPTSFLEVGLQVRNDLQRLLKDQVDVIAPDTLVIAEEFGDWEESRPRIDLFPIDNHPNLDDIEQCVDGVSEVQADQGVWPMRDILSHLAAAQNLMLGRARRMLTEDHPNLGSVPPTDIRAGASTMNGLLDEFRSTRRQVIDFVSRLAPDDFARPGDDLPVTHLEIDVAEDLEIAVAFSEVLHANSRTCSSGTLHALHFLCRCRRCGVHVPTPLPRYEWVRISSPNSPDPLSSA